MSRQYVPFLLLLALSVFLMGCGGEEVECERASDCSQRSCSNVACQQNECVYAPIPDCCGNGVEDAIEDGKPGSKCTCPRDYGTCDGPIETPIPGRTKGRLTEFVVQYCNEEDQCVQGVDPDTVVEKSLLEEQRFGDFDLEFTITYSEPFDVSQDSIDIGIEMVNAQDDAVFPLKITRISLLESDELFGEQRLDQFMTAVGEQVEYTIPIDKKLEELEQAKKFKLQVRYEYKESVRGDRLADGTFEFNEELRRQDQTVTISNRINIVQGGIQE